MTARWPWASLAVGQRKKDKKEAKKKKTEEEEERCDSEVAVFLTCCWCPCSSRDT